MSIELQELLDADNEDVYPAYPLDEIRFALVRYEEAGEEGDVASLEIFSDGSAKLITAYAGVVENLDPIGLERFIERWCTVPGAG